MLGEATILQRWVEAQTTGNGFRPDRMSAAEVRDSATRFLSALRRASASASSDMQAPAWKDVRDVLDTLSTERADQGLSPSETAMFVLSLKEPNFQQLRESGVETGASIAIRRRWIAFPS
jgi:rsbT co-antagonist protein RsbR